MEDEDEATLLISKRKGLDLTVYMGNTVTGYLDADDWITPPRECENLMIDELVELT